MAVTGRSSALTALARAGFVALAEAERGVVALAGLTGIDRDALVDAAGRAADPDGAVQALLRIARRDVRPVSDVLHREAGAAAAWALLGASHGFADFYLRHPAELDDLTDAGAALPDAADMVRRLRQTVGAHDGFAADGSERAWVALRTGYRRILARIAVFDLLHHDAVEAVAAVSAALADAAAAALEASLCVARTRVSDAGPLRLFPRAEIAATRIAVIGMGKCGARELNYVSDVDVVFVADAADGTGLPSARAVDIATRLAVQMIRGVSGMEVEPPLWEVDANLRPEGRQGALVRTPASHLAYYDRWAQSWEFQALMKARPVAGDRELGREHVRAVAERVWGSAARADFVDSVRHLRERVAATIPAEQLPYQLKLGPGGLRDIEFTVQLLQLVHGLTDAAIRQRGTLDALDALVAGGYIGRADAAAFSRDYRVLRVLEHRVQLRELRRTHLMPADPDGQRVLARMSGAGTSSSDVWRLWEAVRREVRDIHVRLFYKPLLSAVAALPEQERSLTAAHAHDRLAAIGFGDPNGALRHIAALTAGVSRTATIQRALMPVMIHWLADGTDPDAGLLAFRRISERLGETPWFLRMLRDSSAAAANLTRVLADSRFVGELMEWIPESAAWLDDDALLRPRPRSALRHEADAIAARHAGPEGARPAGARPAGARVGDIALNDTGLNAIVRAVRSLRERELLRTAVAAVLGITTAAEQATALTDITDITVQALLSAARRHLLAGPDTALRFAVIGMGRYGGAEVGFGSDADVLFVYEAGPLPAPRAGELAMRIVGVLRALSADPRVPLRLDADLRPEGRNGPLVRSLDAYREYYRRWSVSWEAQALLRARPVAGDPGLQARFLETADQVRYPERVEAAGLREIKRIKARVEAERLPQGVDPHRHLKLGPGGLSDVEWLVQLLQLGHAGADPRLRTASTPAALAALVAAGLLSAAQGERLCEAWLLAGRLRSAATLLTGRATDALPADRRTLDGIGRLIGLPAHSASAVEEMWMRAARRCRRVFERRFYG